MTMRLDRVTHALILGISVSAILCAAPIATLLYLSRTTKHDVPGARTFEARKEDSTREPFSLTGHAYTQSDPLAPEIKRAFECAAPGQPNDWSGEAQVRRPTLAEQALSRTFQLPE
jgi:hypothetical protein